LERDLTYAAWAEAFPANRIFYREDTLSDEVYLKWIAVPSPGVTVRLNPSYLWSDKTGLITEPEEAVKFKAIGQLCSARGWLLSGFYDYKNKKNNDVYVTGDLTGAGAQYKPGFESTFHTLADPQCCQRERQHVRQPVLDAKRSGELLLVQQLTRQVQNPKHVFSYGFPTRRSTVLLPERRLATSEKLKLSAVHFTQNKGDAASGEVLLALQAATGTVDSRSTNPALRLAGGRYTLSPDHAARQLLLRLLRRRRLQSADRGVNSGHRPVYSLQ